MGILLLTITTMSFDIVKALNVKSDLLAQISKLEKFSKEFENTYSQLKITNQFERTFAKLTKIKEAKFQKWLTVFTNGLRKLDIKDADDIANTIHGEMSGLEFETYTKAYLKSKCFEFTKGGRTTLFAIYYTGINNDNTDDLEISYA